MEKIPKALLEVENYMKVNLIETFGIPKENEQMGLALEEYLSRGGKYLRPGLVWSTVKAYAVRRPEDSIWAAISSSFDHNWFLIHDDIEDNSRLRRGKPCLHILYGIDNAINYGDYLRTLAEMALEKGKEKWGLKTYTRLISARQEMLKTTCEGQDLEFILRKKPLSETTEEKVFRILEKKSAFYTIFTPYRYGAIISGISDEKIEELRPALMKIGVAFQVQDDVLDLTVEKEQERGEATLKAQKFGKDWAGDLEEMKRTLLIAKVLEKADSKDRRYLIKMLDIDGRMKKLVSVRDSLRDKSMENSSEYRKVQERIDEIKVKVIDIMNKYHVIEEAKEKAKELYEEGIVKVEEALPESEGKKDVLDLLKFAVFRHF
ncbi:MAG: polyprenyl synthetase family protein [Candidatus Aenigmarchaeota archaeon]|nr:polyprenyl synthetase family protein [Candidatus Aenigmarchaeota archaeon]